MEHKTLEHDHERALYIAGALEAYFQFLEQYEFKARTEADAETIAHLRERIRPYTQELRDIRARASGRTATPSHSSRGT